ncbi:glycoside hydrolase family 5 protein [Pelagicoccus sp. SDUM812003]|uniref:glycoside hydrolase family 5 protein n=1 Tax=Pelagicoccus sp. SDUM812003 TaxID=3041267 RepID=UPI00280DA646|nr:glycoside hydrolase family 5 protein [Pelagicoccus sp. SDUM812003]MDQ8204273.1 glycoside hydrolase family 5 protein [Pelagicoccus sp. SDUM812003]
MTRLAITTLLSLSLLMASCTNTQQALTDPPVVPALSVDGTQLVNEHGEPVVLRGVSYGWHNWWPRFYNEDTVKWLKEDWGVDVVRAAMGIHFEEKKRTYNAHPEKAVKIISRVIDGAIENGVYVIIDFHSHHLELELAKTFFADMAERYGKYPNVIYEIYNEPIHDTWPEVKAYAEEVISVIRAIDPDNLILVGNPHWDQDLHIVADNQIEGVSNIMYTLHYYAATHGEYLRERGDYALSKGAPIFISESAGMEASGDGPLDYDAWKVWRDWAEERKISWITWSVSDKDETCSFLFPKASSRGSWKESDLRESAKATRKILREKAGLD